MSQREVRRNIFLYRLFALFNEPLFWGPILIVSLQRLGHVTLSDAFFMESVTMILCVILDIPAGALADVISKKTMIVIGRMFLLASMCGFAFMSSPLWAWAANILWAIGFSFQSGADVSLMYGNLRSGGYQKLFCRIEGRAVGNRYLLVAVSSLVVSMLASIDLRLPLIICIPFLIVPLVVSFKFTESIKAEVYDSTRQIAALKNGVACAVRNPYVRWIVVFYAFIASTSKIWFFMYNPYFEEVGIPIAWYGFIFSLINIVAWLASSYAHVITEKVGEKAVIAGMIACIGVPILLMGLMPMWPFAYLVLFQNIVRGLARPFLGDLMNKHITSDHARTTVLSIQSSTTNVMSIAGLIWFGFMTKHFSLLASLSMLGVSALVWGSVQLKRYKKLFVVRVRKKG